MKKNNKSGVSLVELVVIIAVVVFLFLILQPVFSRSRGRSIIAGCMANVRGLSKSWYMYQEDYDGWIVTGSNYYVGNNGEFPSMYWRWVEPPLLETAPEVIPAGVNPYNWRAYGEQMTLEVRLRGIRAGRLWPYAENVSLYHCPGDRQYVKGKTQENRRYRSYSCPGLMASEDNRREGQLIGSPVNRKRYVAYRMSEIVNPAAKYILVEENVDQAYNMGGWVMFSNGNPWSWWDLIAPFHDSGQRYTLGFVDGHVKNIRWKDERTILFSQSGLVDMRYSPDNEDIVYMARGYFPIYERQ